MELTELQDLGLTVGEIKVYSALLDLGECTKTTLLRKSQVSSSNLYIIADKLLEKGFISKVKKNGVAHFLPANPKKILEFINKKEEQLSNEKKVVGELMPLLLSKFGKSKSDVNVEVFSGWDGMKTVFDDRILEANESPHYVFGASLGEDTKKADLFFAAFNKKRIENNITTKIIFNTIVKTQRSRINLFQSKNAEVRFLDQITPAEIHIYNQTTLIILLTKNPLIMRVRSEDVAQSFKQYFNILWKDAKE
ncbi:MAG: helix-turn-helix domain-containing protein [archaeon]|jgi:sugar-specific transcriptional regulator TrmB